MKGVSVIICCYNSAPRLPETLRHIAAQEVPGTIPWEILVVNNASSDNTSEVARDEWKKHSCTASFSTIDQAVPGLAAAREKGISESKFEYLVFCDDDNWLDPDYIRIAFETMEEQTEAGIAGGQSEGYFEAPKPPWFDTFARSYVVEKPLSGSGYLPGGREYLPGAGMVLRNKLFRLLDRVAFKPILTDRIGNSLMSGGDYELCLMAKYLGFGIYFNENLRLKTCYAFPQAELELLHADAYSRACHTGDLF